MPETGEPEVAQNVLKEMEHLLLDHVFVQHGGYHSDGDDSTAGLDDVLNGLVGHPHHVLSIHLHKVNDL